jgi:hypothetical protein
VVGEDLGEPAATAVSTMSFCCGLSVVDPPSGTSAAVSASITPADGSCGSRLHVSSMFESGHSFCRCHVLFYISYEISK